MDSKQRAAENTEQRAEELARELEWVSAEVVPDLILAALRAEREACCVALCIHCAQNAPAARLVKGQWRHWDAMYDAPCFAAAIRGRE